MKTPKLYAAVVEDTEQMFRLSASCAVVADESRSTKALSERFQFP